MKVWMFIYDGYRTLLVEKVTQISPEYKVESATRREMIKGLWLLQWSINAAFFILQVEEPRAQHNSIEVSVHKLQEELNSSREETEKLKSQLMAVRSSFIYRLANMLVQTVYRPGRSAFAAISLDSLVCYGT